MLDIVSADVVAAEFASIRQRSSSFHKRRAKILPSVPNNFVQLNISGEFAFITCGMTILRYDNKLPNNRIILVACDVTNKILDEANHWFMDGIFKSAPDQLEQVNSINGRIDGYFLPCAYILMQGKEKKLIERHSGN